MEELYVALLLIIKAYIDIALCMEKFENERNRRRIEFLTKARVSPGMDARITIWMHER